MSKVGRVVQKHPKLLKVRKPNNHELIKLIKAVNQMLTLTETERPTKAWKELALAVAPYLRVANVLGEKIK